MSFNDVDRRCEPAALNPTCAACRGACCKTVLIPLTPDQLDGAKSDLHWLQARGVIRDGYLILPSRCRYLDDAGRCTIYETRPQSCIAFPVDCEACRLVMETNPC